MRYKITIPEPCHEKWHLMTPTEKGKFCDSCKKEVFDFTNASTYKLANLLDNSQNICGRFKAHQLNHEFSSNRNSSLPKAGLVFGFTSLLALCTPAQAQKIEKPMEQTMVLGRIRATPISQNTSVPTKNIKGKVLDEGGNPLPGAYILLEGTTIGTQTNFEGSFSLDIPNEHYVTNTNIQVSYIGFETEKYCLDTFKQNKEIKLTLLEDIMGDIIIVRENIFSKIKGLFRRKTKEVADNLEEVHCVSANTSVSPQTYSYQEITENKVVEEGLENEIKSDETYELKFWPNPVDKKLYLKFNMITDGIFSVKLIPFEGDFRDEVVITSESRKKGDHEETLEIPAIENGVYVLSVQTNIKTTHHKLIIAKN